MVEDINNLSNSGFQYNGAIVKITVKAFICDAPARAFLKNIIYHTGYNSCERCEELGEWKGRVVFNSKEKFPSRTDEKFCQVAYKGHQHGETPLLRAGVPCVTSFVLDYMHLVCLGVVRRILHFLYRVTNPRKLSTRQRSELSTRLVGLRNEMPSEVARKPRAVTELDRWKATEFRQFLLYTGPVVLDGLVDQDVYDHFLCLTVGMSILLTTDANRRNTLLQYAADLLTYFVNSFQDIYGDRFTVYNVHALKHIHEDVAHFSCSLNEISAFPFENFMQTIKKMVRTSHDPLTQVAKRLAERQDLQGAKSKQAKERLTVSVRPKDACFVLGDKSVAIIEEVGENGNFNCRFIPEKHTSNLFITPCESKLIDIAFIGNTTYRMARTKILQSSDLKRKAVCIPYRRGHAIFPLLHN